MMRSSILALFLSWSLCGLAQPQPVESGVYDWNSLKADKQETRERRQVLDGTTTDLAQLEIHTSTLGRGMAPHAPHTHTDFEELVIVKEGMLRVTIGSQEKVIGPGSIAYALPGDEHGFRNGGNSKVTYYIVKLKGKQPILTDRGSKAGGSFMIDYESLAVSKTEKGERRNVFDRPTAMFGRFEMHITTLNEGLKSHDPHQHRAEEILLMIMGNGEVQVGDSHQKADPGAVAFLGSQVLHNLTNVGKGPCQYFAFQWQP